MLEKILENVIILNIPGGVSGNTSAFEVELPGSNPGPEPYTTPTLFGYMARHNN